MKYKQRVVELVRHYLITTQPVTQVEKSLGGWHYAERTNARNLIIEQSLNEVHDIITVANNLRLGAISAEQAVQQLNDIFGE